MTTRIKHLYVHVPFCSSICYYCDFCHRVYDKKLAEQWLETLKKEIHPTNYREVVFKDMSNDEIFITRSTVASKETIEVDGKTYPLVKLEITNTSHPFFTGKQKLVDTAGRVDKFLSRYGNRHKK